MSGASDKEMVEITKWLNSKGYDFDMRDGLWMEDYLTEHKWRDVFDMIIDWSRLQNAESPATPSNNARDEICPVTAISCTHGKQQVVCPSGIHCFHKDQAKLSPVA